MVADETTVDEMRELSRYEDLRSCANRAVWTIALQIRRLGEPMDREFVLRPISDAEWLIVSLDRLLQVARQINRITGGGQSAAIAAYEQALPNLRTARNIIAHLDEYLRGDGREKSISVGSLSTHTLGPSALVFGGLEFDLDAAQLVADQLFAAIQDKPPESFQRAKAAYQAAAQALQRTALARHR